MADEEFGIHLLQPLGQLGRRGRGRTIVPEPVQQRAGGRRCGFQWRAAAGFDLVTVAGRGHADAHAPALWNHARHGLEHPARAGDGVQMVDRPGRDRLFCVDQGQGAFAGQHAEPAASQQAGDVIHRAEPDPCVFGTAGFDRDRQHHGDVGDVGGRWFAGMPPQAEGQ